MTECEAHEDCHREATETVRWVIWEGDMETGEENQCSPCASQMERGRNVADVNRRALRADDTEDTA